MCQKFLIHWEHGAVSLCDWKSCSFFNKHALFSRKIFYVEFYAGGTLPDGVELLDR